MTGISGSEQGSRSLVIDRDIEHNDSDNPDALGHCATDSEGEDE